MNPTGFGRTLVLIVVAGIVMGCGGGTPLTVPPEAMPPIQLADAMQNLQTALLLRGGTPAERDEYATLVRQKMNAAVALGEKLFKDPRLSGGNKGQACDTCHPAGGTTGGTAQVPRALGIGPFYLEVPTLLGAAARFPRYSLMQNAVVPLSEQINNCLAVFVGGGRLPLNGPQMRALVTYVSTFSNGETVMVGGLGPTPAKP